MAVCKNCKYYQPDPTNAEIGYCFGHEVSGDNDAALCPAQAFTPADTELLSEPVTSDLI